MKRKFDSVTVLALVQALQDAAQERGLDLDTLSVRDLAPNPKPLPRPYRDRFEDRAYAQAVASPW